MTSINDFATTYMCQSLPFGGVKDSGFDRFAGIEGLRGMCIPKAICEDRSAPLLYPLSAAVFMSRLPQPSDSQSWHGLRRSALRPCSSLDSVGPIGIRCNEWQQVATCRAGIRG